MSTDYDLGPSGLELVEHSTRFDLAIPCDVTTMKRIRAWVDGCLDACDPEDVGTLNLRTDLSSEDLVSTAIELLKVASYFDDRTEILKRVVREVN